MSELENLEPTKTWNELWCDKITLLVNCLLLCYACLDAMLAHIECTMLSWSTKSLGSHTPNLYIASWHDLENYVKQRIKDCKEDYVKQRIKVISK